MTIPWPSETLRNALNETETIIQKRGISWNGEWRAMAHSLFLLYKVLKSRGKLDLAFCGQNPFDRSMIVWCVEAERRVLNIAQETPEVLAGEPIVLPSTDLQKSLSRYQAALRHQGMNEAREEIVMAGAFMMGYRARKDSGDLVSMFDPENEFDQSILVWCMEADRRQSSRVADLSRN
jgi:hypothetical protein